MAGGLPSLGVDTQIAARDRICAVGIVECERGRSHVVERVGGAAEIDVWHALESAEQVVESCPVVRAQVVQHFHVG